MNSEESSDYRGNTNPAPEQLIEAEDEARRLRRLQIMMGMFLPSSARIRA